MLLAICLFLLPAVFSAVLNSFDMIKDSGFIQKHCFDYLPLHEQMKFMLTCRKNHQFLHSEYNQLLELIPGSSHISYSDANKPMKAEIRKLWKYFKLEMENRGSKDSFTLDSFFQIIDGSFFQNPGIKSLIEKDNLSYFHQLLNYFFIEKVRLDLPHFLQLSYYLLKARDDPNERAVLIQNACESPHLFDAFFKHLADNIYNVKRDKLRRRIKREYPALEFSMTLENYHFYLKKAFSYMSREIYFICMAFCFVVFQFLPRDIKSQSLHLLAMLIVLTLHRGLDYIYRMKYEAFAEYDHSTIKRYNILCAIVHPELKYFLKRN